MLKDIWDLFFAKRKKWSTGMAMEFYGHALESLPVAFFVVDMGGIVTVWNRTAEKLTGIFAREILGRPLLDFELVLGKLVLNKEVPVWGYEAILHTKAGNQRHVLKSANFICDSQGRQLGVGVVLVDISTRKTIELELTAALGKAQEVSRMRSELLANMSHEIRTPLNGILGLAEMLCSEEDDTDKRLGLLRISQCGQNLLHLINEILDLSKLESGRMTLHSATVSLADVVREATSTIEVGCIRKGLDLSVHIDDCVPKVIEIDDRKLVQILINLLGNALKFTECGTISVHVAPWCGNRRGDIVFEIKDSGIGIPKDRQQHIFESFVQAEGCSVGQSEGTGLGLAISKKLVDFIGGEIWLESEPGKGSTFSFTIEVSSVDEDRR